MLQLKITLNEKLGTLKNLDEQIFENCKDKDNDIDDEIMEAGSFREQVHECLIKIEEVLTVQETRTSTQDNPSGGHSSHDSSITEPKIKAKLRKLSLKKFNGNPLHWQSWWDCFNSAVHSNDSFLMEIDKFLYMKYLLEGQAAACISGLQLTEKNYAEAVETLKQRLGVRQVIINAHMDSLIKSPSVLDHIESRVRGLQGLGVM